MRCRGTINTLYKLNYKTRINYNTALAVRRTIKSSRTLIVPKPTHYVTLYRPNKLIKT
jgi:hypothetical protein